MYPKPKPRKQEKAEQRAAALAWRSSNRLLAASRDDGYCAIHYFLHDQLVPATEIHHVYSRESRFPFSFREHYTSMLCVCRECHPMPIQQPGASANLGWVEDVLKKANETPINKRFVHKK